MIRTGKMLGMAAAVLLGTAAAASAQDAETVFWQSIGASTDGNEYCAYLAAYPKGKFAPLAQVRARKFGGSCAEAEAEAEAAAPAQAPQKPVAAKPAPERPQSFFTSDHYYEGKKAFDAKDYDTAARLWMEAAEMDMPDAQGLIGGLYHAGLGFEKDYAKAMEWYMKAALRGVAQAQLGIGNLYGDGLGVERSYVDARMWFAIAANGGNERAEYNLEKVGQRMEKADIEKADQMALDWIKKHTLR